MHVVVKNLRGESLDFEVEPGDTVEHLKAKIYERDGIRTCDQRLIFRGRNMEDQQTLAECSVEKDSTIHLVLNIKGD